MNIKKSTVLVFLAISMIVVSILRDIRDVNKARQDVDDISNQIINSSSDTVNEDTQILKIDKINLELPIKHGAIHDNMKTSVATMTHKTVQEGKNFTIAGHRNLRHGKNFNRLNELVLGDSIIVIDNVKSSKFVVDNIDVVEPSEVNILMDNGDTEVTLVTCYPIGISTHRLVVKGKYVSEV